MGKNFNCLEKLVKEKSTDPFMRTEIKKRLDEINDIVKRAAVVDFPFEPEYKSMAVGQDDYTNSRHDYIRMSKKLNTYLHIPRLGELKYLAFEEEHYVTVVHRIKGNIYGVLINEYMKPQDIDNSSLIFGKFTVDFKQSRVYIRGKTELNLQSSVGRLEQKKANVSKSTSDHMLNLVVDYINRLSDLLDYNNIICSCAESLNRFVCIPQESFLDILNKDRQVPTSLFAEFRISGIHRFIYDQIPMLEYYFPEGPHELKFLDGKMFPWAKRSPKDISFYLPDAL